VEDHPGWIDASPRSFSELARRRRPLEMPQRRQRRGRWKAGRRSVIGNGEHAEQHWPTTALNRLPDGGRDSKPTVYVMARFVHKFCEAWWLSSFDCIEISISFVVVPSGIVFVYFVCFHYWLTMLNKRSTDFLLAWLNDLKQERDLPLLLETCKQNSTIVSSSIFKLKAMHDSIHRRRYGGFITLTAHLFTSTAWLVTLTDNKCTIIRAVSDFCCCVACTCEKIQQFYCFIISRTDVVVPFLKGRRDNGKIKKLISTIYCFSKTGTYPEKKRVF